MSKAKAKNTPQGRSQGVISAYFTQTSPARSQSQKRRVSPIDLTEDDHGDDYSSPAKRRKPSATTSPPPTCRVADTDAASSSAQPCSPAQQWRFTPSGSSPTQVPETAKWPTTEEESARRVRREAFKKKLLGDNNSFFLRHRSSERVDTVDVDMDTDACSGHEQLGRERTADPSDASGDESDAAFKNLQEMFSNKSEKRKATAKAKSKLKSTAATAPKKSVEEVGPSGQTYTPLEKQVGCDIP